MTQILAIDTSLEYCGVALSLSGQLFQENALARQNHGHVLLPMIDQLLFQASSELKTKLELKTLDALALANGPGSFTGLRMGAAVIQGLALPLKLPVITISTLQAMAHQAFKKNPELSYCVCGIDARIEQMYVACYEFKKGILKNITPEMLIKPQDFNLPFEAHWYFIGNAFEVYQDFFKEKTFLTYKAMSLLESLAEDVLSLAMEKYKNKDMQSALDFQLHYLQTPSYQLKKTNENGRDGQI